MKYTPDIKLVVLDIKMYKEMFFVLWQLIIQWIRKKYINKRCHYMVGCQVK